MRRLVGPTALACGALIACGGAQTPAPHGDLGEAEALDAGALSVSALPQETDGRVFLSLWVDAGARDAAPGVAALAALGVAATRPPIQARALADAIELSRSCTRAQLEECLRSLADAASARSLDAAAAERAFATRRARGADDGRRADALALSAALGQEVDPLTGTPTIPEAEAFLAAHFGAGRLHLLAVGDVEGPPLRALAARAFGGVPSASARRAVRAPLVEAARAELSATGRVSVASFHPSVGRARFVGRQVIAGVPDASAELFQLRGAVALLARRPAGADALAATRELLERHLEVTSGEAATAPPHEDPRALARWLGVRWATRTEASERADLGRLGVGVVAAGGRGDDLSEEDPDRAAREALSAQLAEALRALREPPAFEGELSEARADVTLEGGARVALRARRATDLGAAVSVRFDGGASEEDPSRHGATALLAEIAALACPALAQERLGLDLAAGQIRVVAVVRAGAWGLDVRGPASLAPELERVALLCAGSPRLTAETLAAAHVRVAARSALLEALASAMSPERPGRVHPGGGPEALHVGLEALRAWRERLLGRRRAQVVAVGTADTAASLARAARALARWPAGAPVEAAAWPAREATLLALHTEGEPEVAIGWRAPAGVTRASASVFARVMGARLAEATGARVRSASGDADAAGGWATIELSATPAQLEGLEAAIGASLASASWEALARRASEASEDRAAWRGSVASERARALTEPRGAPRAEDLRALASGPRFVVIARTQPPAGRR